MKSYIIEKEFYISKDKLIDFIISLDEHSEIFESLNIPDNPDNLKGLFNRIGISLKFDERGNLFDIYSKKGIDVEDFRGVFLLFSQIIEENNFIKFLSEDGHIFCWSFLDGEFRETDI